MSKGKEYQYTYIDRARDAQDDWYLQRRKEISSDDFVQTQLEISEPGDTHEQEADRIASNIVNGNSSGSEIITPVSNSIQTKSEGSSLFTDSNFTSQLQQTKGAGQPLDKSIRNEMESKTGSDLSGVKVHTGSAAHALSESINAKAFTHGQDVYFKNGNYDTNTDKGKELLAHEVVHTVQQKAGVRRQIQRSPDGDKAKKELKIILDKKKADNAVKAHQYLKSLSPDVRQEVYDDNEMAKWITWMDENLPVQYLESLDFGFDAGLDKSELTPPDGDTILVQLFSDDATWKEPVKLELLVMMVTQAGLQTAFVPVLQKQWDYLTPEIQAMLKRNGYDNTGYIGKTTGKLTETSNSRMIGNYLFQSGARSLRKGVVGNYLGIGNTATLIGFSLPMFQKSMGGHVSGVHMSDSGETTTKKELKEQGFKKGKYDPEKYVQTSGTVSLHFDRNEGLFFLNAFDLPFDSMNYQFEDQTVRVGKGTIKKANAKYYWEGKKGSSGNEGKIDVDELVLNNIRSIAGDTTIGIGRLALKTLSITVNQPLGNWQTLPSFYEATLACLDQLLNVLFITMDSGLILADHFFKGVGAGANTELQQLVNSMSSALGMTISFDGLILESLVHNKYAFVNKIELGKTDLLFGTDAYITGYNKSIQRIKQKAADEKRELRPEEQAEIDSLQKAIDNEYRIVELSRLVKAVDAKKSADYEKNQQELDSLLAGRQMAFSITTSLFEVGGVRTRSDATRFDLNMASLQSLNVTSTIGSNGLTTINADWGRSEIGHGENIVDPIGAKYKDETQNYKVGTTMDSGAFRWQEGQGHVLRMKNPVFYSGAIGIGPETVVDMEFQRKDITRTTLEMPFVGMPFLKAEEIVLTWPPNGDMLPDVEVWRPEVKDVELVTTQEISISPKQYIDEFYKEKSEEERAKLLKGQLNPVVIWQMSDVLRVSGKIDGKLKLVRNFENQQWILELSSEKEKVSFIGVHIVSEPRGDGMTPTGHRLDTQHFFNDDEDTPYPMKPSYKSKGATETQGETNDKYKFLDDLKNTAISISAFGKTVSIKADDGGFISPVAALNQIYAGFMDEFEKSPIKRNIRAAIRRMAQHLSGSIEPSFTSWALGWSESEAYSILSTPLSMMDQLRFGTVVSGGYYQLAVYIGGVLRSKTKLAIGDNNTLSKDKTKVRLSAFAEYMTQTSKEEKKAKKYDMVSEALNGALDAFAKEWNDYSLDSHIKYSVNYEEPSQEALVQMIDEWWAQAWPVLAAIAPYAYTNYLMGMIAPSMINSLVKMVATSKPAVHFTSDFSFEGAVGTGTFDLSMDSKFNPQVGISDLTIPQLDKSFGNYHVNLTGFEMHGGLLQTNNWNFAKKDFTCTDASLKTFRLTFPIQKKSLSIGSTSDPLEHEADTIASKVASGQNADLTGVQRFFSGVQRKEQEEEVPLDLVQSLESVSGGQKMDEATRNEMESKMGVDFSGVKIHTNSNAHSMNEQVNAKAFTYGQNIFFRNGNYNPNSQSGKELLAHELVHTVQQSGASHKTIQKQDGGGDDDKQVSYSIAIPPGIKSKEEFRRYAEMVIFHKVVNYNWQATESLEVIYADITNHVGRIVQFTVRQSELNSHGVGQGDNSTNETSDANYKSLHGELKQDIVAEINRRYYEETGITPGTQIKPGDTGGASLWNYYKDQVMREKELLDKLPPEMKSFLHIENGLRPDQYAEYAPVLELLNQFTATDFLDYLSKVEAETTDLLELQRSLEYYLKSKRERETEANDREKIKTKLYGLESLYIAYKNYRRGEPTTETDDYGVSHTVYMPDEDARVSLEANLQANGFTGIDEFAQYIKDYEAAFEKETVRIADDYLDRYEHVLYEEEKKYLNEALLNQILSEINASGARTRYKEAKDIEMSRPLNFDEYQEYDPDDDISTRARWEREAGNNLVKALPSAGPLLQEPNFDYEKFASNTTTDGLKSFMLEYIRSKRESVLETRENIRDNSEHVYELDKLLAASIQMQGIVPGSIYDMIIQDKLSRMMADKIFKAVVMIIIAIALVIASFGTLTPVVVTAGLLSAGISIYGVYEAAEDYKKKNAGHEVGLLTEDPSLIWVMLAIAGAALDLAALTAVFKAAKPIAAATTAFDASEKTADDIVKLQDDLNAIAGLSEQIKKGIIAAAEAKAQAKLMIQSMFKVGNKLYIQIVPGGAEFAKLVAAAYYYAKAGVITFENFILELKAAKLIDDFTKLTGGEKLVMKDAFEKGQLLKNADPSITGAVDKAIAENNFAKLEELISGRVFKESGETFENWVKNFKTQTNPKANLDNGKFEKFVTGDDIQYEITGGGDKIWADGVDNTSKALVDAKHNPGDFYTMESYTQKSFLYGDLENEFQRYSAIIREATNPAEKLIIYISNDKASSKSLFHFLATKHNVPTEVIVSKWP